MIAPGFDGFRFALLNHALGMLSGVLLGIVIPVGAGSRARLIATASAAIGLAGGPVVGALRWA